VSNLAIEENSMRRGVFCMKKCYAIFQNGFVANIDESLQLDLSVYNSDMLAIYLCFDEVGDTSDIDGYESIIDESEGSAWVVTHEQISDEYNLKRQREVAFSEP
jgi:hypothetical protein